MAPFATDNSVVLPLPGDVSFFRNAQYVIFGINLTANGTGRPKLYMNIHVGRKRYLFVGVQFA